jgi:transcriptional regulator with XRE-family HTH domain
MLAKSYGIEQGEEIRIGLQLAQEDLAQLLGASRQRVNQELKGFEREGAVRVEPTRLVVLSRDKLLDIAEGLSKDAPRGHGAPAFTGSGAVAEQHGTTPTHFDTLAAAWLPACPASLAR